MRLTCPYTSKQNRRAERKHRHILETGLTLLAQASMPLKYWWDAFLMSTLLINGLPSQVTQGKSPMELMFDKQIDYGALRIFGSACFPCLRPYQGHKFGFHTEKCVYLGQSPLHKGHKCVTANGCVFISQHVRFNEDEFPFATGFSQSPSSAPSVGYAPPFTQWFPQLTVTSAIQPQPTVTATVQPSPTISLQQPCSPLQ